MCNLSTEEAVQIMRKWLKIMAQPFTRNTALYSDYFIRHIQEFVHHAMLCLTAEYIIYLNVFKVFKLGKNGYKTSI